MNKCDNENETISAHTGTKPIESNRTLFNDEQNSRNLFILLWCFLCCALWVMSLETWTINGTVKCHANRFAVFSLSLSVLLIWPLFCSCKTHQWNCTFQTETSSYTAKGKSEIRKNETRPNTHFQWYLSIGDTKQMTDLDHFVPYYLIWRWIEKKMVTWLSCQRCANGSHCHTTRSLWHSPKSRAFRFVSIVFGSSQRFLYFLKRLTATQKVQHRLIMIPALKTYELPKSSHKWHYNCETHYGNPIMMANHPVVICASKKPTALPIRSQNYFITLNCEDFTSSPTTHQFLVDNLSASTFLSLSINLSSSRPNFRCATCARASFFSSND